jgi:hypothetical protein
MAKPQIIFLSGEDLDRGLGRRRREDRPLWKQLRDHERVNEVREARKKATENKDTKKEKTYTYWQVAAFTTLFGIPIATVQLLFAIGFIKLVIALARGNGLI